MGELVLFELVAELFKYLNYFTFFIGEYLP